MLKVSDYICNFLADRGISDIFMISGGGAMHLNDSVGKHPKLKYICNHHEQASAMAAEGYARASGKIGAVIVTSGPGGTNTLTGVIGQWLDSIPVIYVSGQVKIETTIASCPEVGLRQLGDQEINIVDIVRPITKYAVMATDPKTIRYHLEKAIYLATHGRPGPVWLDIPLDVQAAMIDEKRQIGFEPEEKLIKNDLKTKIKKAIDLLKRSERPVIVAGHGIRLSNSQGLLLKLLKKTRIPVVSTFNGFDLIPTDHELYIGRIGTVGDRAGNFALQNADYVLFLGTRNNIRQVSYNWKAFARTAVKVVVDIDESELKKPTVKPNLAVCANVYDFLEGFEPQVGLKKWKCWLNWCIERKKRYPVVLPEYKKIKQLVQPYYFMRVLTEYLGKDAVVIAGNGTACVALFQAGVVKAGQRIFWNSGCASMGYDLPAAIGACIANGEKDIVCIAGDGSLQMNIQELQTVFYHKFPIKLFVLNNCGYVSIKQTQDAFFEGRRVACCEKSGVSCPDISKVAKTYGLPSVILDDQKDLGEKIKSILNTKGPIVCEVKLQADYKFLPRVSSERMPDGRIISKSLEDMFPFLPREEFKNNMLIDILEENNE